jgi:ABC-type multidrug transport system ATPase subunit
MYRLSRRHVKIGNPLEKGISGGQAKRTNIGIALITSPRVLFLDEPTSGLDSFTANEVMTVVQGLAADGVTILATIHSPTAYAFSLFDSLMMLVSGSQALQAHTGEQSVHHGHTHWLGVDPLAPHPCIFSAAVRLVPVDQLCCAIHRQHPCWGCVPSYQC